MNLHARAGHRPLRQLKPDKPPADALLLLFDQNLSFRLCRALADIFPITSGTLIAKNVILNGKLVSTVPAEYPEYADDTAAATGGLPVGRLYRTGSALKVRVA